MKDVIIMYSLIFDDANEIPERIDTFILVQPIKLSFVSSIILGSSHNIFDVYQV